MTGAATGLAKLIALFAIGAIIGAGFTSYALQQHPLGSSSSSNSKSIASATTVTQIYQSQVVQTATTTVTTFASDYLQLADALNDSHSAKLVVTSYMFLNSVDFPQYKDTFQAQFQNIGNASIVVSPQDCLLNDTFYPDTYVGPAGQMVVYGEFVYVAPGWNFTVDIRLPFTPSVGDNSTLTIYDNSWNLTFGTAKS